MTSNEETATLHAPTSRTSRRDQVMTGALPDGFLQMEQQGSPVGGVATMNYHPAMFGGLRQACGVLNITVVQGRFAKNYGMTRMDPYCRLRVGVQVFETTTAYNGAKTPRWNKTLQCQIPQNVKEFYIEVYDERTFSIDERIAWGLIKIKEEVFKGEVVDDWYTLSGKQGDEKEGMIQLVLHYKESMGPMMMNPMLGGQIMLQQPMTYAPGYMYGYPPVMYAPPQMVVPPAQIAAQQQQQQSVQAATITEINQKDLQTLKEMCPGMDDEIIKSVFQQCGGNLDRAAVQLLEMNG